LRDVGDRAGKRDWNDLRRRERWGGVEGPVGKEAQTN